MVVVGGDVAVVGGHFVGGVGGGDMACRVRCWPLSGGW